ncbi:MAG: TRAP transporter TatT component family protein [Holophaga sp.]|nr:TRAP transporter TatT component family protein [Holophaga sp.]
MSRPIAVALSLLILSMSSGCVMTRKPAWPQAAPNRPTEQTDALFLSAREAFATAADEASVDRSIALHEAVLKDNPGHYQARANAANLYILKGAAFTKASSAKSEAFRKAMTYAELAMYTNPKFKTQVDAGKQPWEAAETLSAAEVEAMYFWVTALQYEFKEGMSLPSKIVNIKWLPRALIFLDRIDVVAPEFGGGGVEVAKMICYYVLPKSRGGSKAKAEENMQKAMIKGKGWLLPRWARGKYYLPAKGDKQSAAADLAWVAAQDPTAYQDLKPWRIFIQNDARSSQ